MTAIGLDVQSPCARLFQAHTLSYFECATEMKSASINARAIPLHTVESDLKCIQMQLQPQCRARPRQHNSVRKSMLAVPTRP